MFLAHSTCFFFHISATIRHQHVIRKPWNVRVSSWFSRRRRVFQREIIIVEEGTVYYYFIVKSFMFYTNKRNKIITFLPCDTVLIRALKKCVYDASITDVTGISFFKQSESLVI